MKSKDTPKQLETPKQIGIERAGGKSWRHGKWVMHDLTEAQKKMRVEAKIFARPSSKCAILEPDRCVRRKVDSAGRFSLLEPMANPDPGF